MAAKWESVNVGDELPKYVHEKVTRTDLVKYAGASGDYNPMHHDETLVEPIPAEVAYYEEAFQTVYKQLYPALRTINHCTFDLQQGALRAHEPS